MEGMHWLPWAGIHFHCPLSFNSSHCSCLCMEDRESRNHGILEWFVLEGALKTISSAMSRDRLLKALQADLRHSQGGGILHGTHPSASVPSALVTAFLVSKCFPRVSFVGVGGFGCCCFWSHPGAASISGAAGACCLSWRFSQFGEAPCTPHQTTLLGIVPAPGLLPQQQHASKKWIENIYPCSVSLFPSIERSAGWENPCEPVTVTQLYICSFPAMLSLLPGLWTVSKILWAGPVVLRTGLSVSRKSKGCSTGKGFGSAQ